MRLVAVGLVLVGLLVGLAAGQSFAAADGALDRADANTAQLVRVQELQTRLVRADAAATNAFLVGGLEPADQRAEYVDAVARAAELVAEAARAQPADGTVLAALNTSLQRYTTEIERARSANRQALPLGATYLRNASAMLRSDTVPLLVALTEANEARAADEFAAARGAWAAVAGASVLGLGALVAAAVWLSRRTHRIVNVPLTLAAVLVLGVLVVSASALGSVATTVGSVEQNSYAATRALSAARIAAFDAKANESLTLVSRGSGGAFEEAWLASSTTVEERLADARSALVPGSDLAPLWAAYTAQHAEIRALDDGGQWEQAVAAATSSDEGSANAAFAAFDAASADDLEIAGDLVSGALDDARSGLTLGTWLGVAAGLLVAVLSWRGLARRIEEYR